MNSSIIVSALRFIFIGIGGPILAYSGVNLLNLRGADINKYALNLMDALYTEDELKTSSFVPVGKSSTSVKPPLSPPKDAAT